MKNACRRWRIRADWKGPRPVWFGVCYMCATPIRARYHVSTDYDVRFVFEIWSGARDLNPRPHGPEPWRGHVLRCPTDSRGVLANTKSTSPVSFGDPGDPADSGRLWPGCDPANGGWAASDLSRGAFNCSL